MRIGESELKDRVGIGTVVPTYLQEIQSKVPSGCLKPQIELNPLYTMLETLFFPYTFIPIMKFD